MMLRAEGYRRCLEITRAHAKTFFFCSLLLEKEKRMAAYSVYAFSRLVDDSFDRAGAGASSLASWREKLSLVYSDRPADDPVLAALRDTVLKYGIPREYFLDLLAGMEMDIGIKEYRSFEDLYVYCYRVAGVIGLIMLRIFGCSDAGALNSAEKMGVAMQLTNILRDIREDLGMGRLYLPLDELSRFGVRREDLSSGRVTGGFAELMAFQIKRARSFYGEGFSGLEFIPGRNSRFIALLMGRMYSGILDSIENNGYDVFGRRNFVPLGRKLAITAGCVFSPGRDF